jgi:hypothetical protein
MHLSSFTFTINEFRKEKDEKFPSLLSREERAMARRPFSRHVGLPLPGNPGLTTGAGGDTN